MLKVSYAVSRLFCKMLFVLCNVKLSKYRYYGMNRGTMRAPFPAADAPWEAAWIQSMITGITASHAVVGQPLLRASCAWRSQARPHPAQLPAVSKPGPRKGLSCRCIVPGQSLAPATAFMGGK